MARTKTILSLSVVFLAGGVVGYFLYGVFPLPNKSIDTSSDQQVRLGNGVYTNPLLECDAADGTINSSKEDFRNDLRTYVDGLNTQNPKFTIAVDYRDLNNGPAFGVDRNDPFSPASLLKVPVMMAYYRHAQSDPSILDQKVVFTQTAEGVLGDVAQEIPPEQKLTLGTSYTVEELIEHMIVYSDNEALALLSEKISDDEYAELYKRLGVSAQVMTNPDYTLSTQQYGTFFRILYNASYLSQDYSEKALHLLTESTFSKGLRAGVPQSISIAHKFGERELQTGEKQLHDCGIVYYPKHPYLLCVMTRGSDLAALEGLIAQVSQFVYGKVDGEYGLGAQNK